MPASYELHQRPELDSPVLVMALEGWIDAGYGANHASATLLAELDTSPVATFDADELLDHRARRPILHLVEGVNTGLSWPAIELRSATDPGGHDLLLLVGAEPDHAWHAFSDAAVRLALDLGARLVIGLGAYPAAVPHTRPVQLSCTANTQPLADAWPFLRGTLDVPAGVQAAIEQRCTTMNLDAIGLWAQVPHYASAMKFPAASLALLESLNRVGGLAVPTGPLPDQAERTRQEIDQLIADNPDHTRMLRALEEAADSSPAAGPLPSGEELAAEFERFLREQGREG